MLNIFAVSFAIPLTLRTLSGSAHVAELLAIQAGLHLLSTLRLRGAAYTDCLRAVKKITRRWSRGHSFQEARAAIVTSCRAYLSDSISIKWIRGHPERSDNPLGLVPASIECLRKKKNAFDLRFHRKRIFFEIFCLRLFFYGPVVVLVVHFTSLNG